LLHLLLRHQKLLVCQELRLLLLSLCCWQWRSLLRVWLLEEHHVWCCHLLHELLLVLLVLLVLLLLLEMRGLRLVA